MCSGRCCSSCLPFPLAGRLAAWAAPAPGRPTSSGCPGRLLCAWAGTRRPPTSLMRQVVWRVLGPQAAWRRERHCRRGTGRGEVAGRADRAGRPSAMVRPSMRPKLAPVAVVVRFVGSVPRRGWLRYESTWPSECGCPPGRPDRRPSSDDANAPYLPIPRKVGRRGDPTARKCRPGRREGCSGMYVRPDPHRRPFDLTATCHPLY